MKHTGHAAEDGQHNIDPDRIIEFAILYKNGERRNEKRDDEL